MKKNIFLLIAAWFLCFLSCRESALSDVEIDDPSLLKVYANVWMYCNMDSTVTQVESIVLRLKDKTDHSVNLKKGYVQCNTVDMDEKQDLLGPYYAVPSEIVRIASDTTYQFMVELADGQQYTGSVSVDNPYLTEPVIPSSWSWSSSDSLKVTWNNVHTNYTTTIHWTITFKEGVDYEGMNSIGSEDVSDVSSYSFPPAFFTNDSGTVVIDKLKVHLSSEKEGELDSRFRSGYVKCKFDFYKVVNIE